MLDIGCLTIIEFYLHLIWVNLFHALGKFFDCNKVIIQFSRRGLYYKGVVDEGISILPVDDPGNKEDFKAGTRKLKEFPDVAGCSVDIVGVFVGARQIENAFGTEFLVADTEDGLYAITVWGNHDIPTAPGKLYFMGVKVAKWASESSSVIYYSGSCHRACPLPDNMLAEFASLDALMTFDFSNTKRYSGSVIPLFSGTKLSVQEVKMAACKEGQEFDVAGRINRVAGGFSKGLFKDEKGRLGLSIAFGTWPNVIYGRIYGKKACSLAKCSEESEESVISEAAGKLVGKSYAVRLKAIKSDDSSIVSFMIRSISESDEMPAMGNEAPPRADKAHINALKDVLGKLFEIDEPLARRSVEWLKGKKDSLMAAEVEQKIEELKAGLQANPSEESVRTVVSDGEGGSTTPQSKRRSEEIVES